MLFQQEWPLLFFLLICMIGLYIRYNADRDLPPGYNKLGSGEMFDHIAAYYDNANRFMSMDQDQSWRRHLVQLLDLQYNDKVLDMSTGTGDVAILIAKKLQTLGKKDGHPVTGFDPSSNMLSFAAQKVKNAQLDKLVTLMQGDAQYMKGLNRNSFDKISMSFGIRNVPDRKKALKELYRVARHRSKIVIMEFFAPGVADGIVQFVASIFLKIFIPIIGSIASDGHSKAYRHLSDSIFNFPSPSAFQTMMEDSGFTSCKIENICLNVVLAVTCTKK